MTMRTIVLLGLVLGAGPAAAGAQAGDALRQAILTAEDARGRGEEGMAPLFKGLESQDAATAAAAVRALGRLERPALVDRIMPRLKDPRALVRFEAAIALAQAAQGLDSTARDAAVEVATLAGALTDLLSREPDPTVLGAAARSLGRLPYRDAPTAGGARRTLLELLSRPGLGVGLALETARGLEALVRRSGGWLPPHPPTVDRLTELTGRAGPAGSDGAKVRRIAWAALTTLNAVTPDLARRGLGDPDQQVRRLVIRAVGLAEPSAAATDLVRLGLADPSPMVRFEALGLYGRRFQRQACGPVVRAVTDPNDHVALEAITLLGAGCPDSTDLAPILWPFVDSLTGAPRLEIKALADWHRGARALVALARVAPERLRSVLSRAATDNAWQVRVAAAEASTILGDHERLLVIAEDRDDNVREAAIRGLVGVQGRAVDAVVIRELQRPDYQLVMTAANLLEGTTKVDDAMPALLASLRRITAEKKETSRDVRLALLTRIAALGGAAQVVALEPYLADFDSVVARRAADVLAGWTGRTWTPAPAPLPHPAVPWDAVRRLRGKRLRVTMSPTAGGGVFEIALDPDRAPATVWRVAERARTGYYDGLTFHRVVPNFVIQGGSPNANEYGGDALYLRDELGPVAHERGTVGISTRGRDTGDAQLFVNLVDNPRLDFEYTVWGWVVSGLDVVDAILQGDVMDRVEVVDGG